MAERRLACPASAQGLSVDDLSACPIPAKIPIPMSVRDLYEGLLAAKKIERDRAQEARPLGSDWCGERTDSGSR